MSQPAHQGIPEDEEVSTRTSLGDLRPQKKAKETRSSLDEGSRTAGRMSASESNLIHSASVSGATSRPGTASQSHGTTKGGAKRKLQYLDFFAPDVFKSMLQDPTAAHRFLKYCESRACGENVEFLQRVTTYNRLLDETKELLAEVETTFIVPNSANQINIPQDLMTSTTSNIETTSTSTLPAMKLIFSGASEHIERLLISDIYPGFVKHQLTTSAAVALGGDKSKFQGLGDSFCMTDPSMTDNPITYASDGFIDVTGYNRHEIVRRNCRFLQGAQTDKETIQRLSEAIRSEEETIELVLNYRKNGEPFWNLLYVSPLFDEEGKIRFYLGGQIDCNTAVHSNSDIMRILSVNDEGAVQHGSSRTSGYGNKKSTDRPTSSHSGEVPNKRSSFFKSLRKKMALTPVSPVREEPGMERELRHKLSDLDLASQIDVFYNAYSKYVVLKYDHQTKSPIISYLTPSTMDLLCEKLPDGSMVPIYNRKIFRVLVDHSESPEAFKGLKSAIKAKISIGRAVSIEMGLMVGETRRVSHAGASSSKVEEKFVGHWTPLKDQHGEVHWVVLTLSPK